MSSKDQRRAARTAYVEREQTWAIVAFRFGAACWITLTTDQRALENRLGFTLRQGQARIGTMQGAWEAAGRPEVSAEVLETLKSDLSPMARETLAEARLDHWGASLGATRF